MWSLLKKKQPELVDEKAEQSSFVQETETEADSSPATKLFMHPAVVVSLQEKYVYQYYHQKLPRLLPNQISISGYDLITFNDSVIIDGFISHTLPSSIRFEEINLLIIDSNQRVLARKVYDFSSLGELPPSSSMPWKFFFEPQDTLISLAEWDMDDWKLAFEIQKQRSSHEALELESTWEELLGEEEKNNLRKLVASLPPLSKEEVNLFGLKAEIVKDTSIALTILIRNGSSRKIELSQLPLQLEDKNGRIIASGVFQLDQFSVNPSSCKPWTFLFPEALIKEMPAELKDWKVTVPQQK